MRLVIDTNVLVSGLIVRSSASGEILGAVRDGSILLIYSTAMLVEVVEVLGRTKFRAKYSIESEHIAALVNLVRLRGELVNPERRVDACRDARDNKFLEAALAGHAEALVTGDADLLSLQPFENIPILRPVELLERLSNG